MQVRAGSNIRTFRERNQLCKGAFFITALKAVNMKSYFKKYAIKFV